MRRVRQASKPDYEAYINKRNTSFQDALFRKAGIDQDVDKIFDFDLTKRLNIHYNNQQYLFYL